MKAAVLAVATILGPTGPSTPAADAATPRLEVRGSPETAERLEARALSLFDDRDQWRRAAELLERAAAERPRHDPRRHDGFRVAGQVYTHVGALADAQRAFHRSADNAAATGAVAAAAHGYLDAASVAVLRARVEEARELIGKAALLARSPHLDGSERAQITLRLPAEGPLA